MAMKAENYMQERKTRQAKILLETAESALVDYLAMPGSRLDDQYKQALPALLQHMKAASTAAKLYPVADIPGTKDAAAAEESYWSGDYSEAFNGYISLLKSEPRYEIDVIQKQGLIGAPILWHLTKTCLRFFDENPGKGADALTQASEFVGLYAKCGYADYFSIRFRERQRSICMQVKSTGRNRCLRSNANLPVCLTCRA